MNNFFQNDFNFNSPLIPSPDVLLTAIIIVGLLRLLSYIHTQRIRKKGYKKRSILFTSFLLLIFVSIFIGFSYVSMTSLKSSGEPNTFYNTFFAFSDKLGNILPKKPTWIFDLFIWCIIVFFISRCVEYLVKGIKCINTYNTSVKGKITRCNENYDSRRDYDSDTGVSREYKSYYYDLNYSYHVNNIKYTGSMYHYFRHLFTKFRSGQSICVMYNRYFRAKIKPRKC